MDNATSSRSSLERRWGAVDTGKQGDDHRTMARRVRCSNGAPQTAPPAPGDRLTTARLNEISLRSLGERH